MVCFTLRAPNIKVNILINDVIMTSCRLAIDAIRGLHPGVVTMALNNALWSQEEEAYLSKIPSVRF